MKVLLINPASGFIGKVPPLGLLCLAGYLRHQIPGVKIKIHDCYIENCSYLETIKEFTPDIVGVYAISANIIFIENIIKSIRKSIKHIVVGGPYATAWKAEIFKKLDVDFIIPGEGEIPFCKLVLNIIHNRPPCDSIGRIISRDKQLAYYDPLVEVVEDLDDLPFPAWDLIDVEPYFKASLNSMNPVIGSRRVLPVFTSRGCPYQCTFCHNIFGKRFRPRSAQNIIDEIELLIKKYHIDAIEIWDDIFNIDGKRVVEFCELKKKHNIKIEISFSNGLRADILTFEIIDMLIASGMNRISFGIESGSARIQKQLCKNLKLSRIIEIIEYIAKKNKVIIGGFFIIGNPTETKEEMAHTINFACSLPIDIASFFAATPQPGTMMFEKLDAGIKNEILAASAERLIYQEPVFDISELPAKEVKKMLRKAYFRFYFSFRRVYLLIKKVGLRELLRNLIFVCLFVFLPKKKLFYK